MEMEYEWDEIKEKINITQHGYGFVHATTCFDDPRGFVLRDDTHSDQEPRFYMVGKDSEGIILVVRFTRRGENIRIFGCANWRKYRKIYHERTKSEEP